MKHIFNLITIVSFSLFGLLSACQGQEKSKLNATDVTSESSIIKFDTTGHDFGVVKDGEKVEWTYEFTNIGKSKLLITKVQASCGCTVPSYSDQPIMPGKRGKILIKFDSNGKEGEVTKNVTVYANTTPVNTELSFKATVNK